MTQAWWASGITGLFFVIVWKMCHCINTELIVRLAPISRFFVCINVHVVRGIRVIHFCVSELCATTFARQVKPWYFTIAVYCSMLKLPGFVSEIFYKNQSISPSEPPFNALKNCGNVIGVGGVEAMDKKTCNILRHWGLRVIADILQFQLHIRDRKNIFGQILLKLFLVISVCK